MPRLIVARRRIAVLALVGGLLAALVPTTSVYAAVNVTPATGGNNISVDSVSTGAFTTLTGPIIQETSASSLDDNRTIILELPTGFRWNTAVGTRLISGANCTLDATGVTYPNSRRARIQITDDSFIFPCRITFVGLQVRATAGSLATGNIENIGTTGPGGATNYGTVRRIAGAFDKLSWVQHPAGATGGLPFGTQPRVNTTDQFGNDVGAVSVRLFVTPGTGPADPGFSCTSNPIVSQFVPGPNFGIATFGGCKINKAGDYRLQARATGATSVDSNPFTVTVGAAAALAFTSYPAPATPSVLTPQPAVAIVDAGGNTVATDTRTVTLSINLPGNFSCASGLSVAAVAGVATFSGCTQTTTGTGFKLTATSTTPNPTVTGPEFAVAPLQLVFLATPSGAAPGQPMAPIEVAIQDGGGTTLAGVSALITIAIGTNPGSAALSCTGGNAVTTINGVATFTGCSISTAGVGYTLTASAANVNPTAVVNAGNSNPFTISAAPPAVISITTSCTAPNAACPLDNTKTPPQANIKLPQNLSEGVTLVAGMGATGANRQVTFEFSKDQVTWTPITTATTDGAGNATTFYRPSDNRYYRASFAGAADLGAATSPIIRIVVRSLVFLRPTGCPSSDPCTRNDGSTVKFTATARPNRPELPDQQVQFVVQRRSGGTFVNVLTEIVAVSKATGTAVLNVSFNTAGTFRLRANLLPTPVNANSFPTAFEYYRIT